MDNLAESFSLEQLRGALRAERFRVPERTSPEDRSAARGIVMLARSNYEVQFQPDQPNFRSNPIPRHARTAQWD